MTTAPNVSRVYPSLALAAALLSAATGCGATAAPVASPPTPTEQGSGGATNDNSTASAADHDRGHGHGHDHGKAEHQGHGTRAADGPLGHRFDRADDWVKRFEGPERDAWQKPGHVIQVAGIGDGMVVADLGAGTGYFLPHLAAAVKIGGKVFALDIEPDMVRYLNERIEREQVLNAEAKLVTVDDPGLGASSVDRILIVDTWHHIPNRAAYAARLATALRPKGAVVVVDFTMESPMGPPRDHRTAIETVVAELEAAGLRAEVAAEELPNQYLVLGWKR